MTGTLQGRVALVTGGTSGIGLAAAKLFARRGASVVVVSRSQDAGSRAVAEIDRDGGKGTFFRGDVSEDRDVREMVAYTVKTFGRLDIAFNNAGYSQKHRLTTEISDEEFDYSYRVNLRAVWLGMKYQIPRMLEGGGGAIVNNSSRGGLIGAAGLSAYIAFKHGVIGLTKSAALEFASKEIRINAVCPGATETPMLMAALNAPGGTLIKMPKEPIGRPVQAEEVAAAAVWLCSDEASAITGVALPVDGGGFAGNPVNE